MKTKLIALNYLEGKASFRLIYICISTIFFCLLKDCFYEKRNNTALHGYNHFHNRWISEYDCFDRCLRADYPKCRSFEHWHKNEYGLCVRANISLSNYSSLMRHNVFVDYYEINCQKHTQGLISNVFFTFFLFVIDIILVIRPSVIYCLNNRLYLTIELNGIDPKDILLGDQSCTTNWFNETHAHFVTNIDNCSLVRIRENYVEIFCFFFFFFFFFSTY